MDEHTAVDDQSHYEISLTAGQAFIAFVLLLLSLAASFSFGLMLGKGQADERLVVKKEPSIVTEAALASNKKNAGEIIDVGGEDDFEAPAAEATDSAGDTAGATDSAAVTDTAAEPAEIVETASAAPAPATAAPEASRPAEAPPAVASAAPAAATKVPHLAQLLSTGDQKTAEALAVRLIDRGFTTAYVERGPSEKGTVYRVRVKFPSEQEARAAEPKLREFSTDVWITAR